MSEEMVTFNLVVDTTDASTNLVEINRLLTTYVSLMDRLGARNLVDLVRKIQQVRVAAEIGYRAVILLYTGTGPIGALLAVGAISLSALMLVDQFEMRRPRY